MVLTGLHKVGGWTRTDRACLSGRAHSPTVDGDYPVLRCDPLIVYGGIFQWGVDQANVQRVLGARSID
jgi:hypothetical protein